MFSPIVRFVLAVVTGVFLLAVVPCGCSRKAEKKEPVKATAQAQAARQAEEHRAVPAEAAAVPVLSPDVVAPALAGHEAVPPALAAVRDVEGDWGDSPFANPIVARVNGQDVSAQAHFERLATMSNKALKHLPSRALTRAAVDRLIDDHLLAAALSGLASPVTDEDVAEALEMEPAHFARVRQSLSRRVEAKRRELAETRLMESMGLLELPTAEELLAEYNRGRLLRLDVVEFRVRRNAGPEAELKSNKEADDFLAAVKGGADFEETAGALFPARPGRKVVRPQVVRFGDERHKGLRAAAAGLGKGEFGGPVRTRNGFVVFRVASRMEPKFGLGEMEPRLKKTVLTRKSVKARRKLYTALRKDAVIEYLVKFPADRKGEPATESRSPDALPPTD